MYREVVGSGWDILTLLFNGWIVVGKQALLDGRFRFTLKLGC
jgi:hypothetical protein